MDTGRNYLSCSLRFSKLECLDSMRACPLCLSSLVLFLSLWSSLACHSGTNTLSLDFLFFLFFLSFCCEPYIDVSMKYAVHCQQNVTNVMKMWPMLHKLFLFPSGLPIAKIPD